MADRVFTDEELIAAHKLAYRDQDWSDGERIACARVACRSFPNPWDSISVVGGLHGENYSVLVLALGVLPEGWRKFERIDISTQSLYANSDGVGIIKVGNSMFVYAPDWPEAVRTGQAEIACRLMAAHVELERRHPMSGASKRGKKQ